MAAANLTAVLQKQSPSETHELLRSLILKVIVGPQCVQIQVKVSELRWALNLTAINTNGSDQSEPPIEINVDATLKRCGKETKLLIGEFEYESMPRHPNEEMIDTLKTAHACNAAFLAGRSTADIAREMKLHRKYVAAVIPLAFLAPGITTAILEGRQPRTLMTKKLLRHVPFDWAEQRRVFGFAAA